MEKINPARKERPKILSRSSSLRWKILFWMFLVAMGPLFIMAYQGYHCAREAIVKSEEAHLQSVLGSRKARFEAWLAGIKAEFQFLAIAPCVKGVCSNPSDDEERRCTEECCNLLDRLREKNPSFDSLWTFDKDWKVLITAAGSDPHGRDIPEDFRSKMIDGGKLVISSPLPLNEAGVKIFVGCSVEEPESCAAAHIVAAVNLSKTMEPILNDRSGLGKTGKVYLTSPEGRFLGASFDFLGLPEDKNTLPAEHFSTPSSGVLEYTDYLGNRVLGTAGEIPDLNWRVVVEIDENEAFSWLGTLKNHALITGAVTLGIVLFLAVRSAGRLSRPLRELAAVSRRIAEGRPEERVGSLEGTEAREVGRAFNKMLDELAASHRRLVHAASLAAVGELSSSIVHEIRNPLSSIKMNLQALQRKVESDAVHSELADIALDQVESLERMLSGLLNYGKPLKLKLERLSLQAICRDALEVVHKEEEEKGVLVEIENRLGDPFIIADSDQMRQVLVNLLVNAVQAAPSGGKVVVSAKPSPEEPGKVVISVCDNGPGIEESQREHLFKPFFTTREGGTGLGLANVKKIVDYHGGTVSAGNRPEGGAVFSIVLPRGRESG